MKLYLIVSLDTECDKGPHWRVRHPLSFENVLEGIPKRLQPLFEHYGVKPSYLLSPEVLKHEECVAVLQSLGDKAELGTHLHAEFIEPQASPMTEWTLARQSTFQPEVEKQKLYNLTALFREKFDYVPRSFRAGCFAIGRYSLRFLEDLGYSVDSSITPNRWRWRKNGAGDNYLGAPCQPYHPSVEDFRKPGTMALLEVPVTLINPFWDAFPNTILRAMNPLNRYQAFLLNRLFKKRLQPRWLRPTYSTAREMLEVTRYLCQTAKGEKVFLCMMFHSNEATAGMSPYNKSSTEVATFLDRLDTYFGRLFTRYDVSPITLSEVTKFTKSE